MGLRIIAGQARGRALKVLPQAGVRPTLELVRGALFSILAPYLKDARVLDLFAGTGALGIEALSRGAAHATFVESHPRQCALLRAGLQELGFADRAQVLCSRVERAIQSLAGPYDIILLDPPYAYPRLGGILEQLASSPLAGQDGVVAVEHSRRHPLAASYGALALVKERSYGETRLSLYQHGGAPW
jgi:16S rRNA (guanine966-N2)-methyltransferase